MNNKELKEIKGHLLKIGRILQPILHKIADVNGIIFRAQLENHEHGILLDNFLEMISALEPKLAEAGKLRIVPKVEYVGNPDELED